MHRVVGHLPSNGTTPTIARPAIVRADEACNSTDHANTPPNAWVTHNRRDDR